MTGKSETRARLERLLAALPVLPDRRADIAGQAERLYVVALLHRADDLPRTKKAGARAAIREIDKLAKLSLALTEHIQAMHREALDAVDSQRGGALHPLQLADELLGVIDAAQRARGVVPATAPAHDLHSKRQAQRVTREAARVFRWLTGKAAKPATRLMAISAHQGGYRETGAFSEFLAGVFRILRIDASAASQVKLLSRKKPR